MTKASKHLDALEGPSQIPKLKPIENLWEDLIIHQFNLASAILQIFLSMWRKDLDTSKK